MLLTNKKSEQACIAKVQNENIDKVLNILSSVIFLVIKKVTMSNQNLVLFFHNTPKNAHYFVLPINI